MHPMLHKIYIHHFFAKTLFYKIAHNTTDRLFNIDNQTKTGIVTAKYKNVNIEFIFNPIINDNSDGLHLVDYFTAIFQRTEDPTYKDVVIRGSIEDTPFLEKFGELLKDKENWIITFFRTEKIIGKYDTPHHWPTRDVEAKLKLLYKHKIITDNYFLEENIRHNYSNLYYAFTNVIWQWNEIISIRYYYEFKQLYDKLNFDYDLMYSVRHHKNHRVEILKGLSEYDNPKILLQRTNSLDENIYAKHNNGLESFSNIRQNRLEGSTDFSNLKNIEYTRGIAYDLFFRFLGRAKMQVLDESWAEFEQDFYIQYLSEKTIGLTLCGIPFISTHSYPVILLQKILHLSDHPFLKDFENHKGNSQLFIEFVKKFMENYDENYKLCKEWMDIAHNKFMETIDTENSLLDLIYDNFESENTIIKTNRKLL
jgi:hypothetical protein